jgi:hypothetical protein
MIVCVTACLLAAVGPVSAQEDREVAERIRSECRAAAQALSAPGTEWKTVRERVVSCPDEGPAYLAEQWRRVPNDTAAVDWLRFHSARTRDARLFAELRRTALDRSRGDVVRVGAMLALMKLADPYGAYWFSDVRPPADSIRRIRLIRGSTTAGQQMSGAQPLPARATPGVLEIFAGISRRRADEPRSVWYAAAVLERRIRFNIEQGIGR